MPSYGISNSYFQSQNQYSIASQPFNPNFQQGNNRQGNGVQNFPPPPPPMQGGQGDSFQLNNQNPFGFEQTSGQGFPPPPPGGPGGMQGGQPPNPEEMFSKLDTDGDGSLTSEEMQAGRPANAPQLSSEQETERFSQLDSNGDGSISLTEMQNAPPPPPPPQFGQQGVSSQS